MKAKLKPWRFEIAWSNPYTNPPDGEPRVLMSVTHVQVGCRSQVRHIAAQFPRAREQRPGYYEGETFVAGNLPKDRFDI